MKSLLVFGLLAMSFSANAFVRESLDVQDLVGELIHKVSCQTKQEDLTFNKFKMHPNAKESDFQEILKLRQRFESGLGHAVATANRFETDKDQFIATYNEMLAIGRSGRSAKNIESKMAEFEKSEFGSTLMTCGTAEFAKKPLLAQGCEEQQMSMEQVRTLVSTCETLLKKLKSFEAPVK